MEEEFDGETQRRDEVYTIWKLFATRGLYPQSLQAFALVSKMHRDLLKECSQSGVFWERLKENARKFARDQFSAQELINFETLTQSPIATLPEKPEDSKTQRTIDETIGNFLSFPSLSNRTAVYKLLGTEDNAGELCTWDELDYELLELSTMKRSNLEDSRLSTDRPIHSKDSPATRQSIEASPSRSELETRRFLRLCYFPVLWLHEYRRVLVFSNVPQKFQETEFQLANRMLRLILKHGRLTLDGDCSFHSSIEDLVWSIEAGRKRRVPCKTYWIPDAIVKEPKTRFPWIRFQSVIGVFSSEEIVNCIYARKTRFRKNAQIYLSKCVLSSDLDRLFFKTTDLSNQPLKW
eukprot:g6882.t1